MYELILKNIATHVQLIKTTGYYSYRIQCIIYITNVHSTRRAYNIGVVPLRELLSCSVDSWEIKYSVRLLYVSVVLVSVRLWFEVQQHMARDRLVVPFLFAITPPPCNYKCAMNQHYIWWAINVQCGSLAFLIA